MQKEQRILIVEDDRSTALLYEKLLSRSGYEICAVVRTGEEGLEKIRTLCPDVILSDILLEGKMDGIAMMRAARKFTQVPVIFISGSKSKYEEAFSPDIRPSQFIMKPVHPSFIVRSIIYALVQQSPHIATNPTYAASAPH